jgi:bifunctional non-homologous end joining protein LigD
MMTVSTMNAELGDEKMLDLRGWSAEQKLDGTRGKLIKTDEEIRIINKELVDYTTRLPELLPEAQRIPAGSYVIDGEICVFDKDGRTIFSGSQSRCSTENAAKQKLLMAKYPVVFMAFDLQELDGRNIEHYDYETRKRLLHDLLSTQGSSIRYVAPVDGDKKGYYQKLIAAGEEGVVLKKHGSRYENRRSLSWLKIKKWDQERCLVIGYTPGEGKRVGRFGALILAKRGDDGGLVYAGKVGSGFVDGEITEISRLLAKNQTEDTAFVAKVDERFQPVKIGVLEVTVKYFEKTEAGVFRNPSLMKEGGRNLIHYDQSIKGAPLKPTTMKEMLEKLRR